MRLRLITLACLMAWAMPVSAVDVHTYVPAQAIGLLPQLRTVQGNIWSDAPIPSFLAAQIEQESCISLTHSKCWNPYSQLKTSSEWGRGLGQVTTAYNKDGSVRFDKQAELRAEFSSLRGWTNEKWSDVSYQITALVEMDRGIFLRVRDAETVTDRLAFTLSAYNGGESGLRQDRLICFNTNGCNRNVWFGHVEKFSLKAKVPKKGYRESSFDINRGYVRNVINVRRPKYEKYFEPAGNK